LARLRLELQELQLKQQRLELQKGMLETLLPGSDFKPVEGKITASDSVAVESDVLMFECLRTAAARLAASVRPGLAGASRHQVVLFSPDLVSDATELASFLSYADHLILGGRRALSPPSPHPSFLPPSLASVSPVVVLKGVGAILQMFQSDVALNARRYPAETRSLQWLVAKSLRDTADVLFLPMRMAAIDALPVEARGSAFQRLGALRAVSDSLDSQVAILTKTISELGKGKAAEAAKKQLEREIQRCSPIKAEIDRVIQTYVQTDTTTGASRIARLSRVDALITGENRPYLLGIEVVSAVAARESNRNAFLGSRLRMSGRIECRFVLTTAEGRILRSDVIAANTPYVQLRKIVRKGDRVVVEGGDPARGE
jgi:hypothetical protein